MVKKNYSKNKKCSGIKGNPCGKLIQNASERCKSCNTKEGYSNPDHPFSKRKGVFALGYKTGNTLIHKFCPDCEKEGIKKEIKYHAKRCKKHAGEQASLQRIGKNASSYIDGRTSEKHYCIEGCGNIISYSNWLYGKKQCGSCYTSNLKGKNNPRYGKIAKHGKGSYYKNIWMRSSYEVAYAKYLDKNNVKWLYEHNTFNLGEGTYTPDFYLPTTKEYIEIKGWWWEKTLKKFNLFKNLYFNVNIKVLMKPDLKQLRII